MFNVVAALFYLYEGAVAKKMAIDESVVVCARHVFSVADMVFNTLPCPATLAGRIRRADSPRVLHAPVRLDPRSLRACLLCTRSLGCGAARFCGAQHYRIPHTA